MGNKVIDDINDFPDFQSQRGRNCRFQVPTTIHKIPKSNPPLPNTHPKIPNVALQHQMHILKLVQKELPRQIWKKYKIVRKKYKKNGRKKYKKIPGRNTTNCQKEIQKNQGEIKRKQEEIQKV